MVAQIQQLHLQAHVLQHEFPLKISIYIFKSLIRSTRIAKFQQATPLSQLPNFKFTFTYKRRQKVITASKWDVMLNIKAYSEYTLQYQLRAKNHEFTP